MGGVEIQAPRPWSTQKRLGCPRAATGKKPGSRSLRSRESTREWSGNLGRSGRETVSMHGTGVLDRLCGRLNSEHGLSQAPGVGGDEGKTVGIF